jgi:phage terminase Nu1 subunit (DNA packaging protein)
MDSEALLNGLRRCKVGVLAKLLGLSERRVRELAAEHGWKVGRGVYDAVKAVNDYLSRNSEKGAVLDLSRERALLAQAQRAKLEMEMAERKRELLHSTDVEFAWADGFTRVRTMVMQLPGQAIPKLLATEPDYAAYHRILEALCRSELARLASAHPGYAVRNAAELEAGEERE